MDLGQVGLSSNIAPNQSHGHYVANIMWFEHCWKTMKLDQVGCTDSKIYLVIISRLIICPNAHLRLINNVIRLSRSSNIV